MRPQPCSAQHRVGGRAGRPWTLGLVLAAGAAGLLAPASARSAPVDFSRDILPILSDKCFLCHGPDAEDRKADLRLDLKAEALRKEDPIIVPGHAAESELVHRITSADPEEIMPPLKSGRTLTPHQVDLLKRWIDGGATWGKYWAFETPRRPSPPKVKDAAWPRTAIDRFVLARLEAEGVPPSPEADRTTLIRRVTLDLTGLPPAPGEVDAFLADPAPDAYERVVDRLLASPRYGERVALDWLDQARFADTNGFQNDFARIMWPWRDWAIDAANRNMPFDQFLTEQIAGDLLPGATRAQRIATGFNRNNRTVTEAGSIDEEWRIENAVDRVETTATVFLGLTMGCARCHDHKYDPISQKEFYQFLGFFNSINEKGVYTEQRGNVPPLVTVSTSDDEARLRRLDAEIAATEQAAKAEDAGLAGRQREWERQQQSTTASSAPVDWAFRAPLAGRLLTWGSDGDPRDARAQQSELVAWIDGPIGKALSLDGREDSFVDAERGVPFERGDRFSYGGWIKPRGFGAILSKMDDATSYRGIDVYLQNNKVDVHLVHSWPGDALKVTTRETVAKETWTHVFVTYDGSGKAAGVKVYLDGRPATLDVQSDTLRGSIATPQPLRIGKRSASAAFNGGLADLRIYRRTLSADEVRALASEAMVSVARTSDGERSQAQRDLLARYYREHVATDLKTAKENVAKLRQARAEEEKKIPTVMVMEDLSTPRDTFLLKRGRYDVPDKSQKLEPGVPAALPPLPPGAPRNRLGLARWLASADNPLTARVTVNRFWQEHFGAGLVKTAENFGLQSEPPTHPELLDWLATEFVRTGWDVKAMHRLIVTSAAYRQVSTATAGRLARDPENLLIGRGPRFRLPAEVVRDNALAIAGLLVERLGGPSIKPYQPAGLWEELAGGAGEGPYVQDKGANLYRRSLYIYRKRTVPPPTMANFDAPSREVCQVKRARTNTPLQALELLNDVTYVEAARQLARLMLTEGGSTAEDRVAFAFRKATARSPRRNELQVVLRGLERYRKTFAGDPEAAKRFIRHGESPLAPGLDPVELAAYTATAGVILNLDETITLE